MHPGRDSARFLAAVLSVIIGCVLAALWAGTAHADTYIGTPFADWGTADTYVLFNASPELIVYQTLGTGISGAVTNIGAIPYFSAASGSVNWSAQVQCFTDSGYTTGCTSSAVGTTSISSAGVGQWATTTIAAYTLSASNYYRLRLAMDSRVSGTYTSVFANFASPTNPYANGTGNANGFSTQGGTLTDYAFNLQFPNVTTGIRSLSPADASTTASTAVSVSIGYYINSATSPGFDKVRFTIYNIDRDYSQEASGSCTATLGALSACNAVVTLRSAGAYSLQASIFNTSSGSAIFSGADATGADNLGQAKFAVVSNPLPGIIGTTSLANVYSLATSTCDFGNISGCFQNAIVWAFYPSRSTLDLLANAGQSVKNKPPFGYLFVNVAAIQALNASGTAPVALAASAPITLYIFSPLDTGLASLFFFFFGVWLFQRVRHIEL